MRVILTAGHPRAYHVLALAELLRRQGAQIVGIIQVSAINPRRALRLLRQRGRRFAWEALFRLVGHARAAKLGGTANPILELLAEHNIPTERLTRWAGRNRSQFLTVSNLNHARAIDFVSRRSVDAVIYGGGGILGQKFLAAARGRVLNGHIGPLPEVRGMNACEWSVLLGLEPTVTIHRIDQGIDTGPAILRRTVEVRTQDTLELLRLRCVAESVDAMLAAVAALDSDWAQCEAPARPESRQCFIMAPVLREIAEQRLRSRGRGEPIDTA